MDPEAVPAEGLSTLADVDDSESMSLDVEYEQLITAAQRKNCLILGRFTVVADPGAQTELQFLGRVCEAGCTVVVDLPFASFLRAWLYFGGV